VTIHPPERLVGEPKKTKKERKEERHPNSGKLATRPDHPRRQIKIKLCVVGSLWYLVIRVKCDPNRLRGYGAVGGRKWPFPITLASTTACTTVQAVMQNSNVRAVGGKSDWFNVLKGVRQVCLLSPYIFNIMCEVLMRLAPGPILTLLGDWKSVLEDLVTRA